MKHFTLAKFFLFVLLIAGSSARAQISPLHFGALSTGTANWYANYVGLQFAVTSPASIAGPKLYDAAYSGTAPWGAPDTAHLINVPIIMDTTTDSFGGYPFGESMIGKIAVIWRGPEASAQYFSTKAYNAQLQGALACVIINEYPGQGPIGMAFSTYLHGTSGATCPPITIPVYMVGNLDGIAMSAQYRSGVPVTMTITPWGTNKRNDVGFVPGGAAAWNSYAVPNDQLPAGVALPEPYKGLDGAFIANYGSSTAKNVKVAATLKYNGTQLHTDTALGEATFTVADSIIAMFTTPEYNFAPPTTGTGLNRYDLTYTISTDTPTQNPGDTSTTVSFYTSDSVYSKTKYDFVNNIPVATKWETFGTTDFTWGDMYYVAHGHDAIRSLQFSLYNPNGTTGSIAAGTMQFYIFQWVDADTNGIVSESELNMVSQGIYNFATTDTSGMSFKVPMYDMNDIPGIPVYLDSGSWYFVAAQVPGSYFLGVDGGFTNAYPRVFGRFHSTNYLEYSNFTTEVYPFANPTSATFPVSSPGPLTYVNQVDSFNYAQMLGTIPSLPLIITDHPDTSNVHVGVNQVKIFADVNVYPNPANDYITVSTNIDQTAPVVSYTILDGLGRVVTKETHYNVTTETFQISTSRYASGSYYLSVSANGRSLVKKFTVIKQ